MERAVGGWVGTGCTYVCWERTEQAEQRKSSARRPLSPHMQQTAPGCGGPPLAPSPAPGDALPLPMDIDDGSGAVPPRGDLRWMHRAAAACGRSDRIKDGLRQQLGRRRLLDFYLVAPPG